MEQTTTTESNLLIAHLGDIHLRDSQYASPARGEDFMSAFIQAIEVTKDADVLVCTGDIFDSSRPSPKVIGQLIRIDHKLQQLGKTMLCITGNHDRSNPTWLETLFPRADGPGIVPLDDKVVTIGGFKFAGVQPYTANQYRANRAAIDALCADADVVLYHGFVTGVVPMFTQESDATPLEVADLPSAPRIKAVLLGDIHVQGHVYFADAQCGKLVAYPGTVEMCSASEKPEKSVPMVRLTPTTAAVEAYRTLTTRTFVHAKVHTTEDLDTLVLKLRDLPAVNPVVIVEFDRSIVDTMHRVHSALRSDLALVRFKPLPHASADYVRHALDTTDSKTLHDFMSERLHDDVELEAVALALVDRGDDDASNIVSEFVERSLVA